MLVCVQAKNSQVAEDLETRLLTECNALLSTWFEDAARMVDSLVSMEHELPDMQVLGDLFRGAGVDIGKREESGSGSEKGAGQQQRKFVMGHLQKKNATTGTWSKRWCVIEPSEQKLVIYKVGPPGLFPSCCCCSCGDEERANSASTLLYDWLQLHPNKAAILSTSCKSNTCLCRTFDHA